MEPTSHDDRLHEGLAALGRDLPEPRAPERVRAWIDGTPVTPVVRAPFRARATTWGLGALAATLALASGVMLVQNARLRGELDRARSEGPGVVTPAARELPPLMAVSYYHDQCPIARAVEPRFEAMRRAHSEDPVLFVTLDLSDPDGVQARRLAEGLGCEFLMSCESSPAETGRVSIVDTRSHEVIATCRGEDDLGKVEEALDAAVVTCRPPAPDR